MESPPTARRRPREVSDLPSATPEFSVCTLVNDRAEYEEMLASFREAGFDDDSCEFLYIDNTERPRFDAFAGINRFLSVARGAYVILCHQDVLLRFEGRRELTLRLRELDEVDPRWAAAGNAGGTTAGRITLHITDELGEHLPETPLPAPAVSLDENFIVVRREANLGVSADLEGFHLYGSDICLLARIRGLSAYVVDFHLYHKSRGTRDETFYRSRLALIEKYRRALADRFVRTTCTKFYVSGSPARSALKNLAWIRSVFLRRDRRRVERSADGLSSGRPPDPRRGA